MKPDNRKGANRPCTRCGAKPPQVVFAARVVAGRSYRHSWCRTCQKALYREYKQRQRADAVAELGPLFGSNHANAKLTEADVLLIWGLIESGLSDYAIAPKFEVSPATVWSIRTGRSWCHCHPRYAAGGPGVATHSAR